MAARESLATLGAKRSRYLRQRVGDELANVWVASGLSVREVARKVGVSADRISRAEQGDPSALTLDLAARIAPVVGLQLAASLHPNGDPVRDRAHLALLDRFRRRLHPDLQWRTEVPMPIAGDLRSADGLIQGRFGTILVEAETRIMDFQSVERKLALKARDLGADRHILVIADTPGIRMVLEPITSSGIAIQWQLACAWRCFLAAKIQVAIAWLSSDRDLGRPRFGRRPVIAFDTASGEVA